MSGYFTEQTSFYGRTDVSRTLTHSRAGLRARREVYRWRDGSRQACPALRAR